MSEAAPFCYYLIASREVVVAENGAIDDCGLAVLLLLMVPYLHLVARLEGVLPGIVPVEGPVPHLVVPGPELGDLLLCEGLGWGREGSPHRPAPQPHSWGACSWSG